MSEPALQGATPPASVLKARMTGEARRQHLINEAIHLFATLGFRGTTTKAIAHAAGVSEAVIFRHFATKEDLYGAMLRDKADQVGLDRTVAVLQRHAARGEDERLVFHLALHLLESCRRDPDFHRVMLYAALEGHDLAKVAGRIYGVPLFGFLREYVVQRQQAGAFRKGDPTLAAFGLLALPAHFTIVRLLFEPETDGRSDRQLAQEFTSIILNGLRAEPVEAAVRPRGVAGRRRVTKASRSDA